MTNEDLRTRLTKYRNDSPVSLSKIGQLIGLDSKQRYVLSRFLKGGDLYEETRLKLSDFLDSRGY